MPKMIYVMPDGEEKEDLLQNKGGYAAKIQGLCLPGSSFVMLYIVLQGRINSKLVSLVFVYYVEIHTTLL